MNNKAMENEHHFDSRIYVNDTNANDDQSNQTRTKYEGEMKSLAAQAIVVTEKVAAPYNDLERTFSKLSFSSNEKNTPLFLCDMGYGLPREERPRKERLNAIAKQLVNFLSWQESVRNSPKAEIKVVACPDCEALLLRLKDLWPEDSLPSHVSVSEDPLELFVRESAIYLSPDARDALDPYKPPPEVAVIGMLIDRRVQPNRSRQRAEKIDLAAARWPALVGWNPQEPFNVDCILEGMQQWHWNHQEGTGTFVDAARQALLHHQERHPQRVQHLHTVPKTVT